MKFSGPESPTLDRDLKGIKLKREINRNGYKSVKFVHSRIEVGNDPTKSVDSSASIICNQINSASEIYEEMKRN